MERYSFYKHTIDSQIFYNRTKNLFCSNYTPDLFGFTPETIACLDHVGQLDDQNLELLTEYTVSQVLHEFCRVNQYISFSEQDKAELLSLYSNLFRDICNHTKSAKSISRDHYQNLIDWLLRSNPFIKEIYSTHGSYLQPVCCSEYNADLQIKLLHLDLNLLCEPILDIGCGENATLVRFLRERGLDVYGIDRFCHNSEFTQSANWLEYDYGRCQWGTIISNLGFSNHFHHNHLRKDGDFVVYAKKYMEILYSLTPSGRFYYAPALPFIETFLDNKSFLFQNFSLSYSGYQSTIVQRIQANVDELFH
ncbi:MAG TPA: hypothetical protein PKE52_09685 [Bacteroidales bacterium]|nr:hypothetical protein [Bacteroidales bacterium]